MGSPEGGHPDLFRFVPISPFSSDLFRFAFLVFRNTPICSDLLRFVPIGFQNKSGKAPSADPFCKPPTYKNLDCPVAKEGLGYSAPKLLVSTLRDFQGRMGSQTCFGTASRRVRKPGLLCALVCQGSGLSKHGRFGKRCFCPLPKTGGFDENR